MGTPDGFDGDLGYAVRAFLGCRLLRRSCLLSLKAVDVADKQKHYKGDNDEADDGVDE